MTRPDEETTLRRSGFHGFLKIIYLREAFVKQPPAEPGAYVVLRTEDAEPAFDGYPKRLSRTHKKQKLDPAALKKRWVPGASLLYVAETEAGQRDHTLRDAIYHLCWPSTDPHNPLHGPGRLIWYVPNAQELLVAWSTEIRASAQLISLFHEHYGTMPFANERAAA